MKWEVRKVDNGWGVYLMQKYCKIHGQSIKISKLNISTSAEREYIFYAQLQIGQGGVKLDPLIY